MDNLNGIHIIDCSSIGGKSLAEVQGTEEFKSFANNFGNALKLNGIVYLINTEVEKEVMNDFEEKLSKFYALPYETKKKYETGVFGKFNWGWRGPNEEALALGDNKETFDFTSNPRYEDDSMYPEEVNGFKEALITFRTKTRYLSNKLLRCLGEYLQLQDKDFFIHKHSALEENYAKAKFSVRTLYYPALSDIPKNATELRLIQHQDLGTFTHLCQNSLGGGLQAKLHNGEWVDVDYIPNSIILQASRSLEMWSGGNIPAVIHRVAWTERSKTESRISFGCFLAPDIDASCLPLVEENPNWTTTYTKMQPGEVFIDYYTRQVMTNSAITPAE